MAVSGVLTLAENVSREKKLAFIGLGTMGFPMAGHLSKAGYTICVYNRTKSVTEKWLQTYEGTTENTPEQAALNADIVLSCVGNDHDLKEVTLGRCGAFHGMKSGSIFIDHSTTSATLARQLYQDALDLSLYFLDAPVSGGQSGANTGNLAIMSGGDESVHERAMPVLQVYASKISYMGASGAGQLTKMVNQICIAGLVQALAEGIHFAENANLDIPKVIDIISKGAAQSWQMENRAQTMTDGVYNHGFAVDFMRKDLGLCLDEARSNGSHLPVTALVDQFYSQIQSIGGNRWDSSSLLELLKK